MSMNEIKARESRSYGEQLDQDKLTRVLIPARIRLLIFFLVLQMGCTGATSTVIFDGATYPVSMTQTVPDRDGRILYSSQQETLGKFEASGRAWSLFWSLLSLNSIDFSDDINEQVSDAGGEAIVNAKILASLPFIPDICPNIFIFHWLPIWPGSVLVEIQGDIIRSKRGQGLK